MEISNEFRQYLRKGGCEQAMCQCLIALDKMKVKHENPVEFMRQHMDLDLTEKLASLRQEVDSAANSLMELAEKYPKLYAKLMKQKKLRMKKIGKKAIDHVAKRTLPKVEEVVPPEEPIPEGISVEKDDGDKETESIAKAAMGSPKVEDIVQNAKVEETVAIDGSSVAEGNSLEEQIINLTDGRIRTEEPIDKTHSSPNEQSANQMEDPINTQNDNEPGLDQPLPKIILTDAEGLVANAMHLEGESEETNDLKQTEGPGIQSNELIYNENPAESKTDETVKESNGENKAKPWFLCCS